MCFGMQTSDEKTTTYNPNPAVSGAATDNLNFVKSVRDSGFTPYAGQQVADFSPDQKAPFGMTDAVAGNGTGAKAADLIDQYSSAGPQHVNSDTISNNMSPYMNQYVMQALAPQLAQQNQQFAKDDQAVNSAATSSGAFGDARAGIEAANTNMNHGIQREGLIGNAYNHAFDTAIGAGASDVATKMAAQNANAGFNETALQRALGGSNALQGLQNQQLGVAKDVNTMGQQQTAQSQAQLTAQYNQWLMAQQYPFQTAQLMNQTVGAGAAAMPAGNTTTERKPDNSGLAALGSIAGLAAAPFTGGMSLAPSLMSAFGGGGGPITYGGPNGPTAFTSV